MEADPTPQPTFVAFLDGRLVASGPIDAVAVAVKRTIDAGAPRAIQVFDAVTSEPWDLDLSGTEEEVARRHRAVPARRPRAHATTERSGPGRPRLGVIPREVTLLPRHWAWLNAQPGGASAALRRLVDAARTTHAARDERRLATERCYRFLSAALGDAPGFEEAARALFAGDAERFAAEAAAWPDDLRTHALALATAAFDR